MKRVIYVLSAAALLTVGIIACSKEQAIQHQNVTQPLNKNGRTGDTEQHSAKNIEIVLPSEIRNLNFPLTSDLGMLKIEQPIRVRDSKGDLIEGFVIVGINETTSRITRIEISENIAKAGGLDKNFLSKNFTDINDNVLEYASGLGACINACNQTESSARANCKETESPQDCEEAAQRAGRACRNGCRGDFAIAVGTAVVGVICKFVPCN